MHPAERGRSQAFHQRAGRKTVLQKFIRREERESLIRRQRRQAGEGQMKLREKLFAPAPVARGFSHDVEDARG